MGREIGEAKAEKIGSRIREIAAEIASIGEFALGSVKESRGTYRTKSGVKRRDKPSHTFQSRGGRGRQRCRHIPEAMVPRVRKLVADGRRYERLRDEYGRLMTELALLGLKKNGGC